MRIKSLLLAVILSLFSMPLFAEVVNINKADAATFQHYLKGVGEKKAQRIIQYRTEHKEFKHIDEIMEVRGIGKKIFNKIQGNLSLTGGVVSLSKKNEIKKTQLKEETNIDSITENDGKKTYLIKIETKESTKMEEITTEE